MMKLTSGIKAAKNSLKKKYSFSATTVIALTVLLIVLMVAVIANSCYKKVLNSTLNAFKTESFVDYDDEYDDEYAEYYTDDEYDDSSDVESDDSDVEYDSDYDEDDDEIENFNQKCNFQKKGPIRLKRGLKIGTFNFDKKRLIQRLTFDLKLGPNFSPFNKFRNIIQFGKHPATRLPAIYVAPNTNQIHVSFGAIKNNRLAAAGLNTKMKLEKNKKYRFVFFRNGRRGFSLRVNGKIVARGTSPITLPNPKNVPIYASHPKNFAIGEGWISNVCMKFEGGPKKIAKKTTSSSKKSTKSMPKKSSSKSSSKSLGVMAVATLPMDKAMNVQDGPEFFTGKYAPAL